MYRYWPINSQNVVRDFIDLNWFDTEQIVETNVLIIDRISFCRMLMIFWCGIWMTVHDIGDIGKVFKCDWWIFIPYHEYTV